MIGNAMWPFSKPARLLRELDRLVFYNEKGCEYARHTPAQVEVEQAAALARIRAIVDEIGREQLPRDFLVPVDSGEVASDLTGRHLDALKAHFRRRQAP